MKKKIAAILTILSLVFLVSPALAAPPTSTATLETRGTHKTLKLPPEADVSPVISLGSGVDPQTGEVVEGLAIIHFKDRQARQNPAKGPKATQCWGYLASGAKWKTVEPWVVNPQNTRGLDSNFVASNLASDMAKWEDAADGVVGSGAGFNILGNGSVTASALVADTSSPDGQNEVYFADVSSSDAIAVTIVWGIFSGPPMNRKLVEWDQVYDDVDFDWSASGEAGKMDFENIATHELGHSVGMDDLYNTACSEETMYGYADNAETNKRDLASGDITGIDRLY